MSKALKRMLASQLEGDLGDSRGVLMIDPGSMTVATSEAFRKDLRERAGGARLKIIHNRTARIALRSTYAEDEAAYPELDAILQGPSAVVYGGDGPIAIAKVVRDWRKKHKALVLKGAIADGELMDEKEAVLLADMPDLPQLKAMLLGAIMGGPRGIAASLAGVYGGLARCIQARVDEAGEGEAADA